MTKNKFILFFCIIIFFGFRIEASGQSNIDSLLVKLKSEKHDTSKINILAALCEKLSVNNFEKAILYGQEGLQLAIKINYKNGIAKCFFGLAGISKNKGDYKIAIDYYNKSLKIKEELRDKKGVSDCYNNIGAVQYFKGNCDSAIQYFQKSLIISEQLNDNRIKAQCYNNIGSILCIQGNSDKALEYYLKSLKINEGIGNKIEMSKCYNNIGNILFRQVSYDKALEYYYKSLKIKIELTDKIGMSNCYNNIGLVHKNQGNYDKAIESFRLSLKIHEGLGDKKGMSNCYNNIGNVFSDQGKFALSNENYLKSLKISEELGDKKEIAGVLSNIAGLNHSLKNYNSSIKYAEMGLKIAKEAGVLEQQKTAYEYLSSSYDSLGNYKKAYENYKLLKQIYDSLFNVEKHKQLVEMETKYQTEKKEKEIELLNIKSKNQVLLINQEKNKKRNLIIIFFALFVLIVTSALLFYYRYKHKQKILIAEAMAEQQKLRFKEVIEAQEMERKRIAEDLHDSLGHMLATAKLNMSELKDVVCFNDSEDESILKNTLELIDDSCKEVRSISHNIMPVVLTRLGIAASVNELVSKINNAHKLQIDCHIDGFDKRLTESVEIAVYRIIQEILSNIIKHADASLVSLVFLNKNNQLSLCIKDNGKGMNVMEIEKSKGAGWKNIYSRVTMLNGSVDLISQIGEGTEISILISLNSKVN
ncbi:MAG: hypothetical protein A2275_04630 [Bacteroidetes bacterium RIFOXYA12_FULL_35_11]|nr:MAG: hypothetical protein A2X01_11150 [Bacteroidetes bacterium GWF2_35_48]OFY75453.1 MAG: hypothetical protein A2275_04630 [Bacteroidetes bacterium RIFOXYA12_FULL_35_11]OFY96120.1 MAG: hypothetical protein A2491_05890 [Bacteroidetes bacterium RIFOXYC12_FULL_35_7]HBX51318.1 hypothetical protein [Bacteroidales bacterium]